MNKIIKINCKSYGQTVTKWEKFHIITLLIYKDKLKERFSKRGNKSNKKNKVIV